ncbi:hypothetical protein [Corynebacterium sp. AOP12-C2-36]|uniref:hypothetical protein n=1 Tax=Corynebacterium sp. AOP12-C2-36 TaxID=3457723 RepID=UPI00403406D0
MSAPTTITLSPEVTAALHELHQAQEVINAIHPTSDIADELAEMTDRQFERAAELMDDLFDLMDQVTHRPREGEDR